MIQFTLAAGLLCVLAFLIVPGLVLLARRPRRFGTAPHCRRCDYLLLGNASAVCPECGLELTPGNVLTGNRRPVAGVRIAGAFMTSCGLFFGLVLLAPAVRNYDWYRLRPTAWVIRDAKSARSAADSTRAWKELTRRLSAQRLSTGERSALVEFALNEQARAREGNPSRPPHPALPDLLDHLGDQCAAGLLSDAQVKQFFDNGFRLTVLPRLVVAAGDPFPVRTGMEGFGPRRGWWTRAENVALTLGGADALPKSGRTASFESFGYRSIGNFRLTPRPPGEYPLTVTYRLRVFYGPPLDESRSRLMGERTVTADATVRAVPRGDAADLQLLDKPELLSAMRAAFTVREFARNTPPGQGYRLLISVLSPPENAAFDVFVRFDGSEHLVHPVVARKGERSESHLGVGLPSFTKPPSGPVDIIFRSNERLARETVDLFQVWKGEIVFKDVPFAPR